MKKSQRAGGLIINSKGEVVIVSNRGVTWSLPKGKFEKSETALEAAKREIHEETGIEDLEYVRELGIYQRHKNGVAGTDDISELKTIYIFLFRSNQEKLKPIDPHNPEARWVSKVEALSMLTHAKDKEFFQSIMDLI